MAEDTPNMGDLVAMASPGADFAARQVLANLEAKLFNRRRDPVHVGRYIIEQRVGAGGSGTVYRAYDPQKDRKVALKLLHPGDGARQEAAQARLFREAQTLTKIDHPNVVKVFDVGTYDATPFDPPGKAKPTVEPGVYIAMEFIAGINLDTWLRVKARSWREIRDVYIQAAHGLIAAHDKGLIHRDFKPANVLVSAGEDESLRRVVVLDFGLARATDKQQSSSHYGLAEDAREHLKKAAAPIDATLTAPGTLLGTPAYMAPEQHARGRGTALSDQYSFCLALYEAWYGHRPFFAETERALEEAKFAGDVMPPPADTDVPAHLFNAVFKGMSAEPADRHPSMAILLEALTAEARSPLRWFAVGAVALAGVAAAAWMAWPIDPCSPRHDPLAEVDNADVREGIATAVTATAVVFSDSTLQRVNQGLDAHADAWRSAWTQACTAEATRAGGEKRRCLSERRTVLAALLAHLGQLSRVSVEHAVAATLSMPDPADCLEDPPPWYVVNSPSGEGAAALTEALADAEVLERLGEYSRAAEAAGRGLELARAASDTHAVALTALLQSSARGFAQEFDHAVDGLAEVLWSASGAHERGLAATAAMRLVELSGQLATPHPDAPLWAQRTRDSIASSPPGLRARALVGLGRALVDQGHTERGLEDLHTAVTLLESMDAPPAVERIAAAVAYGEAMRRENKAKPAVEALQDASTRARSTYGPDHPQTGLVRRALADAYAANGMPREAAAEAARAAEILDAALRAEDPRR